MSDVFAGDAGHGTVRAVSAYEVFELAHADLLAAARTGSVVSIRANVERRRPGLRDRNIPEFMYAQAVFLEASHAHLPIHLDYPLRPRSLREDLAGAVTLLRAQALVYRRALAEADDLVDRTMRHALADLDAAVFYRCEMDWLFDVMRRLAVPSGPH